MWPATGNNRSCSPMRVCNVKESIHARSSKFLDRGRRLADGFVCPQGDRVLSKGRRAACLADCQEAGGNAVRLGGLWSLQQMAGVPRPEPTGGAATPDL